MPNIIQELFAELARVEFLLPRLNGIERAKASDMLRYGRGALALNQYGDIREALDELREFRITEKSE